MISCLRCSRGLGRLWRSNGELIGRLVFGWVVLGMRITSITASLSRIYGSCFDLSVICFESGSEDGANSCLKYFEFVGVGDIYIYDCIIVEGMQARSSVISIQ